MARARFDKSLPHQVPIPESGIAAAVAVMRPGRRQRFNNRLEHRDTSVRIDNLRARVPT